MWHFARDEKRGLYMVAHSPKCNPDKLAAIAKGAGGTIAQDSTELELISGELGPEGTRARRALDGMRGVRVAAVDVGGRRMSVALEMRALDELRFRVGAEAPVIESPVGTFEAAVGAPILPVLEKLRKAGIEAREVSAR